MATTTQEELSSRYDPHAIEPAILDRWNEGRLYEARPESAAEPYTIVIPPPNVTGFLHIGHALNNTLQDILTRWRRMQGRDALWVPGTDHAGIATQHVVERRLWNEEKKDRRDLGREAFLERVWAWKEQYGTRIINQLRRLGCSCDWSRTRFTMDEGLSRAVLTVFKQLYEEGLIYRGDYLVNWSPALQTALSDDEVVHKEVRGHLWHIRYPLADGSGSIEVATKRPETMLGDTAVAVHPEDERYRGMIGKQVALPLMGRSIPIIADPLVEREFGTGAVKVTPAHDPNDYEMGRRHNLEFINILNPDGTLNANAGAYAGLAVAEARKRVVADLDAQGLLVKVEDHVHAVGHDYRSGCVVEPYLSKQWFVRMRPLCEPAVEAVRAGRVRFVPEHYANIYYHWMENVRDWCISRQLWWGHRIPIFYCGACEHVWCEIERTPARCPRCDAEQVTQDPDVLDTWFSSALWPFSTLGWPERTKDLARYYPTNDLVTAHEIIFFWVARMIMMGLKFMGDVPFRQVVINPLVMDEHGKKMSKSSGTAIDPLEVVEEIGADSIRLALASYPTQSRHISLSEKRFESMRNFCNKLWNAARFVLMNTEDLPAEGFAELDRNPALAWEDHWILGALAQAIARADQALESYAFDGYVDAVYKFTWNQYCDWYVELVKDRLHGKAPAGSVRNRPESRRAAQAVLVVALETTLRLLHPVAPFITEEIWGKIRARWGEGLELGAEGLMRTRWPEAGRFQQDASAAQAMELVQEAISRIRNIRGEMNVAPGVAVDLELVSAEPARLEALRHGEPYFRSLVTVGSVGFGAVRQRAGFAATSVIGDVTVHVYLPEELREREKGRLEKEIARLEKGVRGAEGKLGNEKFLTGAPAEVVEAERERLERLRSELETIRAKRAALG